MRAVSFGERASNSSATRGRPPVMSRVFGLDRGSRERRRRARPVPAVAHLNQAPPGTPIVTGEVGARGFDLAPRCVEQPTCGRAVFAAPRRCASMTTERRQAVTSSTCLATVTPSSTFSNFARPRTR